MKMISKMFVLMTAFDFVALVYSQDQSAGAIYGHHSEPSEGASQSLGSASNLAGGTITLNRQFCGSQSFISIDCGISGTSTYADSFTKIQYTSDTEFVTTGINKDIAPSYQSTKLPKQLATVRAFPDGAKNCYTLKPTQGKGKNYLIRAVFMYGNYDSLNKPPKFDLHIGVDLWGTIKLDNSTEVILKEMIHTPSTDLLYVCLANTGNGTPFISTLELRHFNDTIYTRGSGSLDLFGRFFPYTTSTQVIRYDDDIYDRTWSPATLPTGSTISTIRTIDSAVNTYRLPSSVMEAAFTPKSGSNSFELFWIPTNSSSEFYAFMHIAEIEKLRSNETREFNITLNNGQYEYGPYSPYYLQADTIYFTRSLTGSRLTFTYTATNRSTHPPILNAVELYMLRKFSQHSTYQIDADAMVKIKSTYTVSKNWQGDPCSPRTYMWDGVNCSHDSHTPTIIYLNLSSSGLTGEIANSISSLTSLEVLDLSNNDLTGEIPDFLADLASLTTLNLAGTKLTGPVPSALLRRSNEGTLALSLGDDPGQCSSGSCSNKKSNKLVVPIVASVVGVLVIAAIGICTFWFIRKKRQLGGKSLQGTSGREIQPPVYVKKKGGALSRFSHSQVKEMTKGFEKMLGKGGFGTVYYGCLKEGSEVAVKSLQQSIEGSKQFRTEVELLMSIRHKNLVSLVGYCDEKKELALIYEYMAKGDLDGVISGDENLSWKQRLQIAIDAAQGLDYLHNGCRPSIIHRDVKTPNILLNENMEAKVADFGLSKMFPDDHKAYISTRVIGTPAYLDPEYRVTQQLTEKSDVYSFGVVLLELITGKRAIIRTNVELTHIVDWVRRMLDRGDIWSIVDPRLQDVQNPNSVWRMTDISMVCVKPTSDERPMMSQIVTELKECLSMEMEIAARGNGNNSIGHSDSLGMNPVISFTAMNPAAR